MPCPAKWLSFIKVVNWCMIILKKYVIGIWQKNDRNMAETRQKHDSEN